MGTRRGRPRLIKTDDDAEESIGVLASAVSRPGSVLLHDPLNEWMPSKRIAAAGKEVKSDLVRREKDDDVFLSS